MLDTLLEIGRTLRTAPENAGLRHHRYVKTAPRPDEKNPVVYWKVEVAPDGTFDFDQREEVEGETLPKSLFYLNFKSSDSDAMKKYIFGDIYHVTLPIFKNGRPKEDGNFRVSDPQNGAAGFRPNSFLRGEVDARKFHSPWLNAFRDCFRLQLDNLETILLDNTIVYIHFDHTGKHWHQLPEMKLCDEKIMDGFGRKTEYGYVLDSFIYKTLKGDKDDIPGFGSDGEKTHRSRSFSITDLLDLLYAIEIAERQAIGFKDLKVIVLPRGEGLTFDNIETFFRLKSTLADKQTLDEAQHAEEVVVAAVRNSAFDFDAIFAPLENESIKDCAQFDFIFSKANKKPTPDADMIEISGLERSKLSHIAKRIGVVKRGLEDERKKAFPNLKKESTPFSITFSFLSLLGDTTTAKKKFQAHLFQVLPQIYTETYFRDPVLLPALIQKTEFHLREGIERFPFLRFDFLFLTHIQNEGELILQRIKESPSYQLGLLLGMLARPLKTRINSFDKNYAGLLSRRIGNIGDVMSLVNDLNQKLIMHGCVGFTHQTSHQISLSLGDFSGRYDKDECAFGFFESYYAPIPKKEAAPEAETTESADAE